MVIGGGIGPGHATGQEGELRASAVVIQAADGSKVCLVACDVLMVERDILDPAARAIAEKTGIPFDHILINCTHTHHAPTTVTVHGYPRDEAFARQLGEKAVAAAVAANERLAPATFRFRLGEESSVGKNSRLLLKDGTIFWVGPRDDAVRPTGPFDPELPVLAFLRPDGTPGAVLFNHSTHTIGTLKRAVRSPSFYGLAAQELEAERGGTFLFFEGASGSTHNLDVSTPEAVLRIKNAVADALDRAEPRPVPAVKGKRSEITLKVRHFDDPADDAAVVAYCTKRQPSPYREKTIAIFRDMRKALAPRQGQDRKTWVQAVVVGDVALVGVPGEFFTVARPGDQEALALPVYLCVRAGQRLRRLRPRRARLRPRRLPGLDWPAQLPRQGLGRGDRRRGGRAAQGAARVNALAVALACLNLTAPADPAPTPAEALAALRLADPKLEVTLVASEPDVACAGGGRLGRARADVRRRDDRLPARARRRPGQAARGPRRRRPLRARHGVRRRPPLAERRAPLERRRARHGRPRPDLLQGQ